MPLSMFNSSAVIIAIAEPPSLIEPEKESKGAVVDSAL